MINYGNLSQNLLFVSITLNFICIVLNSPKGQSYVRFKEARDIYFKHIMDNIENPNSVDLTKYVGVKSFFDLTYDDYNLLFMDFDFVADFGLDRSIADDCLLQMLPYLKRELTLKKIIRFNAKLLFVTIAISVGNIILNIR